MSILTANEIKNRISVGDLAFKPKLDKFQLQGHSVDLRLGFTFLIPRVHKLTPKGRESLSVTDFDTSNKELFDVVELEAGQYFEILPHEHILISTLESVKIPNDLMAILYPRSSTNRKGLSLDLTGIIDSGYEGQLVLPVRNNNNSNVVRLYPGERICQITLQKLSEPVESRKSKYHKRDVVDGVQKEKNEETNLIKSGQIIGLKKNFSL